MAGWYRVVKTIKGHRYLYEQRTWREGKRVRTANRYLGPAAGEGPSTATERSSAADLAEIPPALVDGAIASLLVPTPLPFGWLLPWDEGRKGRTLVRRVKAIEEVLARLGLERTELQDGAWFDPLRDRVNVPPPRSFVSFTGATATQGYYATLLHEVAHWTGHRERLARHSWKDLLSSERYAREELVAEATAMILQRHFGVAPEDLSRQAVYFQGWLGRAGKQEEALAYAREEAERAARFILGR